MEHAKTVSPITVEQAKALIDEVSKINGITVAVATKIADLLPRYPEDVRAVLSKERVNLDAAAIKKVTDAVAKYL